MRVMEKRYLINHHELRSIITGLTINRIENDHSEKDIPRTSTIF